MELEYYKKSEDYEKLLNGEYLKVTCKGELIAEFEYFNDKGLFVGYDGTENFEGGENTCVNDLQDEYRINEVFKPKDLFEMLKNWKKKFPELVISGRTLLEKRIDNGTL